MVVFELGRFQTYKNTGKKLFMLAVITNQTTKQSKTKLPTPPPISSSQILYCLILKDYVCLRI